jgi:hypothetical protein
MCHVNFLETEDVVQINRLVVSCLESDVPLSGRDAVDGVALECLAVLRCCLVRELVLFGGAFLLALFGISPTADHQSFDYYEALGLSMASLSNVGPAMGYYGPAHSWAILSPVAKCTCSVLMLIGRLEIFPVLLLFTRSFWKKT